jgi:hypothetical protein
MGMEVTVRLAVGRYRPAGGAARARVAGAGWARGRAGPLRANGRGRIEAARGFVPRRPGGACRTDLGCRPLVVILVDGVNTKFMGETAARLRLVFASLQRILGVYFFDELDALGSHRASLNLSKTHDTITGKHC